MFYVKSLVFILEESKFWSLRLDRKAQEHEFQNIEM